jgi:hypothetical protein
MVSAAWFGDHPVAITFPSSWEVEVVGRKVVPPLSDEKMRENLRRPSGTPPLRELARGRRRAAIIIDDMTRPTPTAAILPILLEELEAAGMERKAITVVVACGAHHVATGDEIARKIGGALPGGSRSPHDRRGRPAGKTDGEPHPVNRPSWSATSSASGDLSPSLRGYPRGEDRCPGVRTDHPLSSRLLPGGGMEVTWQRNASRDGNRRQKGLDFIVNVILNQERRIAGLFAGEMVLAFREGAAAADELYGVNPIRDADVIVSNAYPFDTSLGYMNRGFWPFVGARGGATKVIMGAAPMGRGTHRLSPLDQPLPKRILRRVKEFRPVDGRHWRAGLKIVKRMATRWRHDFLVLSRHHRRDLRWSTPARRSSRRNTADS